MKKWHKIGLVASAGVAVAGLYFSSLMNPSRTEKSEYVASSITSPEEEERQNKEVYDKLIEKTKPNAFHHYLKAASMNKMSPPSIAKLLSAQSGTEQFVPEFSWEDYDSDYTEAMKKWNPDFKYAKELEELLEINQSAFDEVRKGLEIEECWTVPYEDKGFTFETPLTYLSEFRDIVRKLVIQGNKLIYEGRSDLATQNFLDAYEFGADTAREGLLIDKLVSIACEQIALDGIERNLQNFSEQDLESIVKELPGLMAQRYSLHETIKVEYDMMINSIKQASREELVKMVKDSYLWLADLSFFDKIKLQFMNKEVILKEIQKFADKSIEYAKLSHPEIKKRGDLELEVPDNPLLQMLLPVSTKVNYAEYRGQLYSRAILQKTAFELYKKRNGEYPDKFVDLIPILEESLADWRVKFVNGDPFMENQSFEYFKTQDGYILYSYGPDMDDDKAQKALERSNPLVSGDGDVIFSHEYVETGEMQNYLEQKKIAPPS